MEKYEIVIIYDNNVKRDEEYAIDIRTTDTKDEIAYNMIENITRICKNKNISINKTLKFIEDNLRRCDLMYGSVKPEDFIKSELDKLVLVNNKIRASFEIFDIDTYFIEILPLEIYQNDESYIEYEEKLSDLFEELYDGISIHFISENALCGIKKPIYVATGSEYVDKK